MCGPLTHFARCWKVGAKVSIRVSIISWTDAAVSLERELHWNEERKRFVGNPEL